MNMTQAEPHVASGTILPYLKSAQDHGLDPDAFLAPLNLTTQSIKQQQPRLPESQTGLLLMNLIEASGNPWLGLDSSKHVEISTYDINGYISVNCSCPLEAIKLTAELQRILSDSRVLHIRETHSQVISTWNLSQPEPVVSQNIAEHLMSSYVKYGQSILQLEGHPEVAKFRHKAPKDTAAMAMYEEIFQCPLLFEQEHYELAFNREEARDLIIPQADPVLRDMLIAHALKRISDIATTLPFTYQVKSLIKQLLAKRVPSRDSVAEHLNMGSRTMQRRLLTENSSYKDAFNSVRQELALHYLRDEALNLDDIAEKLGFSETRSFHRSFKQWTGGTVGAYRDELLKK